MWEWWPFVEGGVEVVEDIGNRVLGGGGYDWIDFDIVIFEVIDFDILIWWTSIWLG